MELRKIISLALVIMLLGFSAASGQDSSKKPSARPKTDTVKKSKNDSADERVKTLFKKSDSLINASKKLFIQKDTDTVRKAVVPPPAQTNNINNNSNPTNQVITATVDTTAVSRKKVPFKFQPLFKDSLNYEQFLQAVLINNKFFKGKVAVVGDINKPHINQDQDWLFYIMTGVFLLLAIIRLGYRKYFSDMFLAFYNPTLSQRQLKEQLTQTPFPGFLLNAFFAISTGLYLFLLLRYFHYIVNYNPYIVIGIFILLFSLIYLIKFLFLRLSGWLFGNREMINGYIFIIYLSNKILGICLLPLLLLLAFSEYDVARIALYISLIIIILLFGFRYVRAYGLVKNYINFNKFHFFLYLCAFEIVPLLVIAKLLLIWLNGNA